MNTYLPRNSICNLLLALLCILSMGIAQAQDGSTLTRIMKSGTIRIANTQTSPPYSMLDENNQPTGFDVAVAKELADRLGIANIEFVADTYANFVSGLKAGRYDLVMNALTPTKERKKQIDFSIPYAVERFRIFVREDNTDITDRASLAGKRVGVSAGSSNATWSHAHLTESTIQTYKNSALIFRDLELGRIDAIIISHFGGIRHAQANGVAVKEVGPPLTFQLLAAGLAKGQPDLLGAINQTLKSMLEDGTIARLSKKYIGDEFDILEDIEKAKAELAQAATNS